MRAQVDDFKLRDTCEQIDDGERAALIAFALTSLVVWALLAWWYTTGNS